MRQRGAAEVQKAGSRAQPRASMGLRSTRATARQREVSDGGTSNVSEPESLRKTHLTLGRQGCVHAPLCAVYADAGGDSMASAPGLSRTWAEIVAIHESFAEKVGATDWTGAGRASVADWPAPRSSRELQQVVIFREQNFALSALGFIARIQRGGDAIFAFAGCILQHADCDFYLALDLLASALRSGCRCCRSGFPAWRLALPTDFVDRAFYSVLVHLTPSRR